MSGKGVQKPYPLSSMTGYGAALCRVGRRGDSYEGVVRSLNSKQLDLQIRLPFGWDHREGEVRHLVETILERGRIQVSVLYATQANSASSAAASLSINEELFAACYTRLRALTDRFGACSPDTLARVVLRLPGMVNMNAQRTQDEHMRAMAQNEKVWKSVLRCIKDALNDCKDMRMHEGNQIGHQIKTYIDAIAAHVQKIEKEEKRRNQSVEAKLVAQWKKAFRGAEGEERFQQELFYYLERMAFEEERVRLVKHIAYFEKTLKKGYGQGRKLGFIAQEINREINTLGSKAHDAVIQGMVVEMKNELEKIKEQLLNIL